MTKEEIKAFCRAWQATSDKLCAQVLNNPFTTTYPELWWEDPLNWVCE